MDPVELGYEPLTNAAGAPSIEELVEQLPKLSCQPKQFSLKTQESITCLQLSNTHTVLAGSATGKVCVYGLAQPGLIEEFKTPLSVISDLVVTQDGDYFVVCGDSTEVLLYSLGGSHEEPEMQLRGHTDSVTALAMTEDSHTLISGSKDCNVIVWNLDEGRRICTLRENENDVNCVAVSPEGKYVISGCSDAVIRVWKEDLFSYKIDAVVKTHKSSVLFVQVSGKRVFSADKEGTVVGWNLNSYEPLFTLPVLEDRITCMSCTHDERYLVTGSEDCGIRFWNTSGIEEHEYIMLGHESAVSCLAIAEDDHLLVSADDTHTIRISSLSSHLAPEMNLHGFEEEIYSIRLTANGKHLVSAGEEGTLRIWNSNLTLEKELQAHDNCINAVRLAKEDRHILTASSDATIKLWRFHGTSRTALHVFEGHQDPVNCIELTSDGRLLVSGSDDQTIKVWNMTMRALCMTLDAHASAVNCLKVCSGCVGSISDNNYFTLWSLTTGEILRDVELDCQAHAIEWTEKYLVLGLETGEVHAWRKPLRVSTEPELKYLGHSENITCLLIQGDLLYTGSCDATVKIWSLQQQIMYVSLSVATIPADLSVSVQPRQLFVACIQQISVYSDPTASRLSVFPEQYYWLCLSYVKKILSLDHKHFDPYWNDYIIFPYRVNLLHIFIYANHPSLVSLALAANAKMLIAANGMTPLHLCLSQRNNHCADIITKRVAKVNPTEMRSYLGSVQTSLTKMIQSNLRSMPVLFQSLFPLADQKLAKYAKLRKSPPIIRLSKGRAIAEQDFIDPNGKESHLVEYRVSVCKFHLQLGSSESIDLLNNMRECSQTAFFKTPLVKAILAYKWKQVRWILYLEMLIFVLLIICFSAHTLDNLQLSPFLGTAIFVINSIVCGQELIQLVETTTKYIRDLWNVIDMLRVLGTYFYLVLYLANGYSPESTSSRKFMEDILCILTLLTWTRGLAYFRIFKKTRYLIRMIIEIVQEMIPFIIILLMATLAFALMFYIIDNEQDIWTVAISTYRLDFGDFDVFGDDSNSTRFLLVFLLASFINPLVLLNLLIAIMGDTYDRVQEEQVIADSKEMLGLILEAEALLFWKRKNNKKMYLQMCTVEEQGGSVFWEGRINEIKKNIHVLENRTKVGLKTIEEKQSRILGLVEDISRDQVALSKQIIEFTQQAFQGSQDHSQNQSLIRSHIVAD